MITETTAETQVTSIAADAPDSAASSDSGSASGTDTPDSPASQDPTSSAATDTLDSPASQDSTSSAATDTPDGAASQDPGSAAATDTPDSAGSPGADNPPVADAGASDGAGNEDARAPASPGGGSASVDQITQIAAQSALARYSWKDRGVAPKGYIKGMALAYARVYCKLNAGDAAATEMAKANSADDAHDALAWYDAIFAAAGMKNDTAGIDTLRHLFVLLIGLGMRESSGKYCEGRDKSASNTTAETAEAGLFQTSFNARTASPLLPMLFAQYSKNPSGFVDVFKEGLTCSAADLENFGSGDGKEFQRLSKACPAFAAEFAAVGLRHLRAHWGPINRRGAEVRPECDEMLRQVQAAVDGSPELCSALQ
jgi:hypothetical protein